MLMSIRPGQPMAGNPCTLFIKKKRPLSLRKFPARLAFAMLALMMCCATLSQAQTTWYVSNGGNDGINTGTSAGSAFATIGHAISVAVSGDAILAAAGTYDEDIDINKTLSIRGASWTNTTLRGIIGGNGSTVRITANNVEIAGFTITRIGNNTTDWNNAGLNSIGISIQGTTISGALIRDNFITGNRSGIDINNSSTHTIRNNDINFNRTGLIFRNQTDNLTILENNISDNWTAGILFLDASGGTNSPVQTALNAEIHNNNISGNWYGQIVERQAGGSLPAPGTNLKNFTCNWYGTTSPVVTTAGSTEPGYSAQIPVAYGGSATNPGGQPDIAGAASANVTYSPMVMSGTDVNIETAPGRGTNGFQPVAGCIISCALSGPVHNTSNGNNFCSLQAAVNDPATVNGNIITIDAGTYNEQVLVNKQLTIKGSTLTKPVLNFTGTPSLASGKLTLFEITAPNVTIEGLNLEVDLSKLGSAIVASSATLNNLTVKNNDINPYRSGPATTSYGIRNAININYGSFRVNNINPVVNIEGNAITYNAGVDLIPGNADDAGFRDGIATDEGVGIYTANTIQAISQDIESRFSGPGLISLTNNSFNGGGVALQDFNSATGNISVTGNTFNGTFGSTYTSSLRLVDNQVNKATTVSGNTFSGHNWGISLENYKNVTIDNNVFTAFPNSTTFHHITVNTKVIATSSGVVVQTAIGAVITRNTFNGSGTPGGTALSFYNHDNDNAAFGTFVIGSASNENNFNAGIANFILLDNQSGSSSSSVFPPYTAIIGAGAGSLTTMSPWAINLDAVNNKYDVGAGLQLPSAMSLTNLFSLEDKIQHGIDVSGLGFVLAKANNNYVTVNSFLAPATTTASIQRGIDAASNGFIVNVAAGSFAGNSIINKEVEIKGQGIGSTIVVPGVSNPNTGGGSLGGSNIFLVQANNVTIDNLTADGDNPALTSSINVSAANIDARNGIITNHSAGVYNNLTVHHTEVKNIFLRAIYASSGGTFNFHHNTVANVKADPAGGSIAIFNFGGSGTIDNNSVSDANDAIAANNSTGTVFSNNTVTGSASGIHTDNNGSANIGTADDIFNNNISNSSTNGYGIWVFAPYKNVTVHSNTISNVAVGMASAGQYAAVTPVFSNNLIDGQGRVNSTGMYATSMVFGFGNANNTTSFINNYVTNTTDGFVLEAIGGFTLNFGAHFNSISNNSNSNVTVTGAGTINGDMSCNWWDTTVAGDIASSIDGTVTYAPFLGSGTDSQPGTVGFQTAETCVACALVLTPSSTPAGCLPNNDGTASVSASGGAEPYTYSWNTVPVQNTATATGLTAGTYTVTVVSANGCSSSINATVAQTSSIATTPVVSGIINVCPYVGTGTLLTYTATPVPGASSYAWTVPASVTIVSGQGTNSIVITINNGFIIAPNKQLRVRAISSCGNSLLGIFYMVAQAASTPSPITGTATVCSVIGTAGTLTYTIPSVLGAQSYIWQAQAGTTTITHPNGLGINDTTVTVSFTNGFTNSNMTVQSFNACGASSARNITLTRNIPSTPGLIAGSTNACENLAPSGVPAAYSVAAIAGQTYNWTVPPSSTGLTGQGTNAISFTYPSNFINGSVLVTATNGCGTSGARSLSINKLLPATPGVIDVIQEQACPNRIYSYTVSAIPAHATSVQWTVPFGATLLSGQGSTSIMVSYPGTAINSTVKAQAMSNCGTSGTRTTTVHLPSCPEDRSIFTKAGAVTTPAAETMKVNVYPNPTVNDFKLQVITAGKQTITVRILDAQGRSFKTFEVMPYQTVNVGSDLKAGAYIMEVRQGAEVKLSKLLKF